MDMENDQITLERVNKTVMKEWKDGELLELEQQMNREMEEGSE